MRESPAADADAEREAATTGAVFESAQHSLQPTTPMQESDSSQGPSWQHSNGREQRKPALRRAQWRPTGQDQRQVSIFDTAMGSLATDSPATGPADTLGSGDDLDRSASPATTPARTRRPSSVVIRVVVGTIPAPCNLLPTAEVPRHLDGAGRHHLRHEDRAGAWTLHVAATRCLEILSRDSHVHAADPGGYRQSEHSATHTPTHRGLVLRETRPDRLSVANAAARTGLSPRRSSDSSMVLARLPLTSTSALKQRAVLRRVLDAPASALRHRPRALTPYPRPRTFGELGRRIGHDNRQARVHPSLHQARRGVALAAGPARSADCSDPVVRRGKMHLFGKRAYCIPMHRAQAMSWSMLSGGPARRVRRPSGKRGSCREPQPRVEQTVAVPQLSESLLEPSSVNN